ncbi:hypothetical protein Nepgr_007176 [Nepenthes gracilis]|uniref:CRIB domain-containing protein n=1 Tax=Nepenthes gracilis TaxID=150966 RepID=A0AAD3S6N5_NEPGR|nr:hypothetical protein Nepgr_007176 [Nepenthes gracilis]
MATKMKGICKGIKYISHLFVVKEREMEIGYPTDVKHLAHIGWDGPDGSAPSWMSEFRIAADSSVASVGSTGGSRDPTWSSQDFEQSMGRLPSSNIFNNFPPTNLPSIPKKQKRKKGKSYSSPKKSNSSPKSSSSSRGSSRMSRKSMLAEREEVIDGLEM